MDSDIKHNKGYYQCTQCGKIYFSGTKSVSDSIYIEQWCKECGEMSLQLWVGEQDEDKYIYADPILDIRYYQYKTK